MPEFAFNQYRSAPGRRAFDNHTEITIPLKEHLKLIQLSVILLVLTILTIKHADAQQEFPPPQGEGRVVVVISGMLGPSHDQSVTRQIAQLGYDAVLFEGTVSSAPTARR
jgi:hypothetical protein